MDYLMRSSCRSFSSYFFFSNFELQLTFGYHKNFRFKVFSFKFQTFRAKQQFQVQFVLRRFLEPSQNLNDFLVVLWWFQESLRAYLS